MEINNYDDEGGVASSSNLTHDMKSFGFNRSEDMESYLVYS